MAMDDWIVTSYRDPENPTPGGKWVYKINPSFPGIHFSMSVDDAVNHHMGTDNAPKSYYYGANQKGAVPHYAGAPAAQEVEDYLLAAWLDYFTVTKN